MSQATSHLGSPDRRRPAESRRAQLRHATQRPRRGAATPVTGTRSRHLSEAQPQLPDGAVGVPAVAVDTRWYDNLTVQLPVDESSVLAAVPSAEDATSPTLRPTPRVSVVIPTYNEAQNLPHVLPRLPEGLWEVIVVDGRSVDDTVAVARALRADVKIVVQNRVGKGNAMACGFAAATGDVIVMLDADGSADPDEIPRFVAALVAGADFAKGTRFAAGGGSSDITRVRAWGNRWLNRTANSLFGTRYTDLCYGYNSFWRHCLDSLDLDPQWDEEGGRRWGDGFEIETIINTRIAKARLKIVEVPSFEKTRLHGESNLNTWRDGARVLRALVVERVNGSGRARTRPRRLVTATVSSSTGGERLGGPA